MLTLFFKRTVQALGSAFAAMSLAWLILPLAPGDPANRIFLARGINEPTELELTSLRAEMGLDDPLIYQFLHWITQLFQGDLGISYATGRPVIVELFSYLPASLLMLGIALLLSILIALILAFISVLYQNHWPDRIIIFYTEITAALPTFVFALLALNYVIVGGQVGKVLGEVSISAALLPAFIIGLDRAGGWTQLLRANLLAEMRSGYAFVARSRGSSEIRILLRHAFPNGIKPLISVIGLSVGALLGGAPLIEAIFSWPGIGSYLLDALTARDFPVIQAYILFAALAYVIASYLADIATYFLDPRLREENR